MLKKAAAVALSAALVLSPLAAFAQTDTTAPAAGAPAAAPMSGDNMAPAKPMKHKSHKAKSHKKMKKSSKSMAPAAPAAPAEAPKS